MSVVYAPVLAGSRDRAQQLLSELPRDVSATEVVVDCRGLLAATVAFADELVREVLVQRRAGSLRVIGDSDGSFTRDVLDRAAQHEVDDRLVVP